MRAGRLLLCIVVGAGREGKRVDLVVLTGASGGGKTTLARAFERQYPDYAVHFFDSIGVPSWDEMKKFGDGHEPGGAWQRAMTLQWFKKLAAILETGRPVLFEGQMRPAFIGEALEASNLNACVVLVDCDDATRAQRLISDRRSPELANEQMMRWAEYLRSEAAAAGYEVLDTGKRPFDECVDHIYSFFTRPLNAGRFIP